MGSLKLLFVTGAALVFLQLITGVFAWGKDGHYITCKIAEGYLSKDAKIAVKQLLPDSAEGQLANVCSWPDQFNVRVHRYWSKALHYVDTPDFKCNYEYCRDCHDNTKLQRKYRCVTAAIYNYTLELSSACDEEPTSDTAYNSTEALMFLSHFMGDVHQPLHAGFVGDLGGNKIELRWFRRKANLHHVWDTEIIDTAVKRFYDRDLNNMIQALQNNLTGHWSKDIKTWEKCGSKQLTCPDPYAAESVNLACKYAYKNATPGIVLEDDYFLTRLPVVEKRLVQGGIRLAATLNRVFDSCSLDSHGRQKQLMHADLINEPVKLGSRSGLKLVDLGPKCPT